MKKFYFFLCALLLCCLTGCMDEDSVYAPVSDINSIERIPKDGIYHAAAGETLYAVAWRYGLDYRDLASRNHIAPPYRLSAGQVIYLRGKLPVPFSSSPVVVTTRVKTTKTISPPITTRLKNTAVHHWYWPAHGPVIASFSGLNKGINIGGRRGNPVYATAAGEVVYSGNGLRSYGNLIIIQHNNVFMSAYAYNSVLLVRQGEWVQAGQKIVEMGMNKHHAMLHFEIRKAGRPINPLNYLAK